MKHIQIWEYDGIHSNLQKSIDFAKEIGMDSLLVKGINGTYYHGEYTTGPDYIHSPEDAQNQADFVHSQGLQYHIWGVPRPGYLDVQASMIAGLANIADGFWLDVEPYPAFWGIQSASAVRALMDDVRLYAPDRLLVLQPDPRLGHLQEIHAEVWAEYVQAISGQHYWSDFYPPADEADALRELTNAHSISDRYGLPVWPTVPANCLPASLTENVQNALTEFDSFAVWRMGSGSYENWYKYGAVQSGGGWEDPVVIEQLQKQVADLQSVLGYIGGDIVQGYRTELSKTRLNRKQITAVTDLLERTALDALGV